MELKAKAWMNDHASLRKGFTEVSEIVSSLCEKSSLFVRFMEWFSSRGRSYEQNLRVVDDHLKRLSESSSKRREAYESNDV